MHKVKRELLFSCWLQESQEYSYTPGCNHLIIGNLNYWRFECHLMHLEKIAVFASEASDTVIREIPKIFLEFSLLELVYLTLMKI